MSDDSKFWQCAKCEWINRIAEDVTCKACGTPNLNPPVNSVSEPEVSVAATATPAMVPNVCVPPPPVAPHYRPPPNTNPSTSPPAFTTTTTQTPSPSFQAWAPAAVPTAAVPTAQYDAPSASLASTSYTSPHLPPFLVALSHPPPQDISSSPTSRAVNASAYSHSHHAQTVPVHSPPPQPVPSYPSVFRIREKFWGFGDNFTITDASTNQPVFIVQGKVFSWGDKLSFREVSGRELAYISQELFALRPRYQNGTVFAQVVKEFTWFNQTFTLDIPGPNDYTIQGSFWQHDFVFLRGNRRVAQVSKRLLSFTDSYGVQIEPGEDVVAILCACIVIDQVLHDDR